MPLDPNRVQAVFLTAVECRDPPARADLLDRECATDVELRRRVEALLTALDHPESLLDRPIVGSASHDTAFITRNEVNGLEGAGAESPVDAPAGSNATIGVLPDPDDTRDVGTTFEMNNRAVPTISGYESLSELG